MTKVEKELYSSINEVLPELDMKILDQEKSLKDLGADSVDRMDIVSLTMRKLDLDFPLIELSGIKKIGELIDHFQGKLDNE